MLLLILLCIIFPSKIASVSIEKTALLEFKFNLKDPTNYLSSWTESNHPCEFAGVSCDPDTGTLHGISLENVLLVGSLSGSLCQFQGLRKLVLTSTSIYGTIPLELSQCSNLKVLNLTLNKLVGRIPDFSGLRNLEVLDLSGNFFSGEFPPWVGNLTRLVSLGLGNNGFDKGTIPKTLGNLKNMTWLFLSDCQRVGEIPESIFELRKLDTLDLSINQLSGTLSKSIGKLGKVTKIELFANTLIGEVPSELADLTRLREFDISVNYFCGKLPPAIGNLQNLTVFQLYKNRFTGELPQGFGELSHLKAFSIYSNSFSGEFPSNFGRFSPLNSIDISENHFTGPFPSYLCESRNLEYLLALDNEFSGAFPASYADCKSLVRFRINQNRLSGKLPSGVWAIPNVVIMDFSYNKFTGEIYSEIGMSGNLSMLILEANRFTGILPAELGKLTKLERLYLNNNLFSGEIPTEVGALNQLSSLQLEGNFLNGSIPSELGQCKKLIDINLARNVFEGVIPSTISQISPLNSLNLSGNRLSGSIPAGLGKLKLSLIDLSKNQLSGSIPLKLFTVAGENAFGGNKDLCTDRFISFGIKVCDGENLHRKGLSYRTTVTCIVLSLLIVILLSLMFIKHFKVSMARNGMDTNWKVESFHQLEVDVDEICNLEERNLIGRGSTGEVYRLELKKSKVTVAVKKLSKGAGFRVFYAEKDILGKIRHRNILKLYACLQRGNTGILVFEYMPKGNLFQALQREIKGGKPELDWCKRYNIALGVAKGLGYLHHDCAPHIIHRDIKSTNILLGEDYEPKVADFGVASVSTESPEGSIVSCYAGTHGYLAPELAYSRKVTEKSDVYSFGVVLLELLTGKRPIEEQYGEGKDIVHWVLSNLNNEQNEIQVLDSMVALNHNKHDMMNVLKIATQCINNQPSLRPTMRDVVKMLTDAHLLV